MLLKVCGATRVSEVAAISSAGADLVGLWHGVPGGNAELDLQELTGLAEAAEDTGRVRPVLVTLESTVETVIEAVARSGIRWVQLHGYQQPGMVRALKAAVEGLTVVKALHVRDGRCVERPLVGAYERAGVDVFLLDSLGRDGRVGSTARPMDPDAAVVLTGASRLPVMLAGGLTADTAGRYRHLADRLLGVDVDSAARGPDGHLDPTRVAALRRAFPARTGRVPLRDGASRLPLSDEEVMA